MFLLQIVITCRSIFFPSINILNKDIFNVMHKYAYLLSIINKSLKVFDTFIKNNIFKNWLSWSIKLIKLITKVPYQYITYLNWVFDYIIRLGVCLCFTLDVVYYHKINYLYKALPLLLIPLIYKYILYTLHTVTEINLEDIKDVFIINEDNKIITSFEYCKILAKKVLLSPSMANTFFSDNYLLHDNLKQFTFQWTDSYIAHNEITFKDYNDTELSNFFLESYLVYNQLFVLTSIYLYTLDYNYKNMGLWVSFMISFLYFFNWLYILIYGII